MDDVADGVGVDTVGSGQGSDRGKAGSAADGVNGLPIQFVEGVVFGGSGCHEGILLYFCVVGQGVNPSFVGIVEILWWRYSPPERAKPETRSRSSVFNTHYI